MEKSFLSAITLRILPLSKQDELSSSLVFLDFVIRILDLKCMF